MSKSKLTQKDTLGQEAGLRFISECGHRYEKPSIYQILDEIQMVCMNQFRAAYEMLTSDDFSQGTVENLLFVTLAHWDRLSEDIGEYFEGTKKQNIFDNDRFWEYVAQIRIDKHDPADILEVWLKENKPDYFKN